MSILIKPLFLEPRKDIPKSSPFAFIPCTMINTQRLGGPCLERLSIIPKMSEPSCSTVIFMLIFHVTLIYPEFLFLSHNSLTIR